MKIFAFFAKFYFTFFPPQKKQLIVAATTLFFREKVLSQYFAFFAKSMKKCKISKKKFVKYKQLLFCIFRESFFFAGNPRPIAMAGPTWLIFLGYSEGNRLKKRFLTLKFKFFSKCVFRCLE